MSWDLASISGNLARTGTPGDYSLVRSIPCVGTLNCGLEQVFARCITIDICGLQMAQVCMTTPLCAMGVNMPPVQRPLSFDNVIGRHLIAPGGLYGCPTVNACGWGGGLEAFVVMDGWMPEVMIPGDPYSARFVCNEDAFKVAQPYDAAIAYNPKPPVGYEYLLGQRIWTPDTLRRRVNFYSRLFFVGDVLNLGVELTTRFSRQPVDYLLFRGFAEVPGDWTNESGVPQYGLEITNLFTCEGDDAGSFEPYSTLTDESLVGRTFGDHVLKRYSWEPALYPAAICGRLVVAVGGTITVGSPTAISPCTAGTVCTTPAWVDVCSGEVPGPDVPPSPPPTIPPVVLPHRKIRACPGAGGPSGTIGEVITDFTGEEVVSFNSSTWPLCYRFTGPRRLLPDTAQFPIPPVSQVYVSCDDCWMVPMVSCDGESARYMSYRNWEIYGKAVKVDGICWGWDPALGQAGKIAWREGLTMIELPENPVEGVDYFPDGCVECQASFDCVDSTGQLATNYSFSEGASIPAGTYTVSYKSGAVFRSALAGWYVLLDETAGFRVVHSGGAVEVEAPGIRAIYGSAAEATAAMEGLSITINHTGGPIHIIIRGNNAESGSARFCLE